MRSLSCSTTPLRLRPPLVHLPSLRAVRASAFPPPLHPHQSDTQDSLRSPTRLGYGCLISLCHTQGARIRRQFLEVNFAAIEYLDSRDRDENHKCETSTSNFTRVDVTNNVMLYLFKKINANISMIKKKSSNKEKQPRIFVFACRITLCRTSEMSSHKLDRKSINSSS